MYESKESLKFEALLCTWTQYGLKTNTLHFSVGSDFWGGKFSLLFWGFEKEKNLEECVSLV
jgi:hypothetical protein